MYSWLIDEDPSYVIRHSDPRLVQTNQYHHPKHTSACDSAALFRGLLFSTSDNPDLRP